MSQPMLNTDEPEVRCGMCGGRARVCSDPLYRRGARVIECAGKGQPYPFKGKGRCAWSSLDPARVDPSWYWRMRVRLGR